MRPAGQPGGGGVVPSTDGHFHSEHFQTRTARAACAGAGRAHPAPPLSRHRPHRRGGLLHPRGACAERLHARPVQEAEAPRPDRVHRRPALSRDAAGADVRARTTRQSVIGGRERSRPLCLFERRVLSSGVQHGQDVDLRFRRNPIDDQIRQPDDRKLARPFDGARAAQHRELPEHHRRLHDPGDDSIRGALIVFGDPVADRGEIVARLRREINAQASAYRGLARPGSSRRGSWLAPVRVRPWRASRRRTRARQRRCRRPACRPGARLASWP